MLVLPLTVLCSILQGHWCQHAMAICKENPPCVLRKREFPQHQRMEMTIAHLVCMLHVSVFSEIEGRWHHAIKKPGPAHRNSFARPFFAVLLNVLLDFSSEKSAGIKLFFHNIYLSTLIQGELVFTFCFPLGWKGLGINQLMLWTDWNHSVESRNGMVAIMHLKLYSAASLRNFEKQSDQQAHQT